MTDRSEHERKDVEDALRARASLAGEEFSGAELAEGGSGGLIGEYLPGDPLDDGEELVADEGDETR